MEIFLFQINLYVNQKQRPVNLLPWMSYYLLSDFDSGLDIIDVQGLKCIDL